MSEVLGFLPRVPLQEALGRTWDWFRETGCLESALGASDI